MLQTKKMFAKIQEPVQVMVDALAVGATLPMRYDAQEDVQARGMYPPLPE